MTEQEIFVLADQTLNDVVAKIADDQWDMRMAATFARRASGEPPTLRQIINYHAYDDSWVPDMLAGKSRLGWPFPTTRRSWIGYWD
jgi:hypothetical protein